MAIKSLLKEGRFIKNVYWNCKCVFLDIKRIIIAHNAKKSIMKKLRNKEKILVLLVGFRKQTWLYKEIYRLFSNNDLFNVICVAAPFVKSGKHEMHNYMAELADMLENEQYSYVLGYDSKRDSYVDIKKMYNPDVVIFSTNYNPHTEPLFYMSHYNKSLNYIISYGMHVVSNKGVYASEANYLCYREFVPNERIVKIAKANRPFSHAKYGVVGSPKLDCFLEKSYNDGPWKLDHSKYKRIIWAPHFSFEETGDEYVVASFLEICDYMFEIADLYSDSIEFIFKPHPLLRHELERYWSVDKINHYYEEWNRRYNTQFYNGDYFELFMTSDAMIFDSISFIVEYLFTRKPALYTVCSNAKLNFNEFGKEALALHYHTTDLLKDIKFFIDNVVVGGVDEMKPLRVDFINKFEGFSGTSSSKLIYQQIVEDITK